MSVEATDVTGKVIAFTRMGDLFWVANHLLLLAIPVLFLFLGWSAALRTACGRVTRRNWFATVALVASSYTLVTGLILLPLSYLRYAVLHDYLPGPRPSAGRWIVDQLVTVLIEAAAILIVAWIPYGLLSRSPRRWWLWSSVLLAPVVLFVLILQPFWISPLTSRYAPLTDRALLEEIIQMADRCHAGHTQVFVGGDDYQVAGLGPTKRILLGARYAEEFSPSQLRFLVAHELAHNVNGDNWTAWAAISVSLVAVFWLTHVLGNAAIDRWQHRLRFSPLSDPASLPLIVFFLVAFMTLLTPFDMSWSRHIEREADRFGLELTHENRAAASMFAGFEQTYLESPDPGWFALMIRWNHPPAIERINFANEYHPWSEGEPLHYASVCRMP